MLTVPTHHPKRRIFKASSLLFRGSWNLASIHRCGRQVRRSSKDVIFSGIQPTGVPHLGNYLGALQQWARLQNEAPPATQLIFSIVDLHAITMYQNAERLRRWKRETLATLLAVGLDPERSTIFYQSAVPAHVELMWILSCTASVGYLSRMTQWKSKLELQDGRAIRTSGTDVNLKLGLFSYPVLQAADILVYGATHVPVGEDQVQHLEFARECAHAFNATYGQQLLKEPATILSTAKRIMSLKEPLSKMSKSHHDMSSRIHVNDSPEDISRKIRAALTDSVAGLSYDPLQRPGVSNLIAIMSFLDGTGRSFEEIARVHGTLSMREFKERVAATISQSLEGVRARYSHFMTSSGAQYLDDIAAEGAIKARRKANRMIVDVKNLMGL